MPQDTQRTNELLEALLSRVLTNEEIVDEIDGLIRDLIDEDIHLDYKHGDALADRRAANELIREYVGGFANSAGGTLMVGIDEDNWQVTGCQAPGGGSLTNWASRSLTPIAGYLSPPPVLYEVPHPDGPVLVAAVARAPGRPNLGCRRIPGRRPSPGPAAACVSVDCRGRGAYSPFGL
jgi:hypothetical protein